ncbi:MAG: STAS domain-containing protein [Pseudomonadota bacterium]
MDPIQVEHRSGATHVALAAAVGIAEARVLHETLGKLLPQQTSIVFHSDRLQRIDAAAMQILAAFCVTARKRGLALAWQEPSASLREAATLLGLESTFGFAS